mgnify:CR=1 FL=1
MLVVTVIALLVMLGAYSIIDASRKHYAAETDLATAQAAARSTMHIFSSVVRVAGYSPFGAPFFAIPQGDAFRIRLLSDRDADGVVGTAGEAYENLTYLFADPDNDSVFDLQRGVDLDGDGDFLDPGESVDTIATDVVPIDVDGDNSPEPFLAYDLAPPATRRLRIVFGVRTERREVIKGTRPVVNFVSDVFLRNRP